MEVLYLLIPLALVLVVIIGGALFWAIRSGQFEDMEGPAYRILMDDDDPRIPRESVESTDEARLQGSESPQGGQVVSPSTDSSEPPSPPSERP
jgi:cbb3-type cytochrome oxidase maturation protein